MAEIDTILSESLKRIAVAGDPAGVAETIESRVESGDTGTPQSSSHFGSGWSWLPWVGGGLAIAVAGTAVGATGILGSFSKPESQPVNASISDSSVMGLDCPGGTSVVSFAPHERILAVARSEDSSHLAVRSPLDRSETVWLALGDLELDPNQASIQSLPVDGCIVPTITVAQPEPIVEPQQPQQPSKPDPGPKPPAPDTTNPVLGTPTGDTQLGCTAGYGKPESTLIKVTASDNKAVSSVQITWSGADSGSAQMSGSGSNWQFSYNPPDTIQGIVTFSMVAKDSSGNLSAPKSFQITVDCLI